MRSRASFALLALVALAPLLAPAAADDARSRLKDAFKPLPLEAPAKLARRLDPTLPAGIVIEAAPFDRLIAAELEPFAARLDARAAALEAAGREPSPDTGKLVRAALDAVGKELAELDKRIAGVEKEYADVFNRGYMESSEGARTTRKRAAVLVPVYRTLQRRDEALLDGAATALARFGDGDALAWLLAAARGDSSAALRAAAVDALARIGGDEPQAALRDVLAKDKDASVRQRALGGLMAWKLVATKDAAVAALADPAWNVRALAVAICTRGDLVEAVGALVDALDREEGRLRKDVDDALSKLTKAQFFGDVEQWRRWWADNAERVKKEAADRAAKGAYDEPLGLPRTWNASGTAAEDKEERKGHTSAFYGIPTVSKRILYVIDISKSMESDAEAKPAVVEREKTRYSSPKTNAKIDIAKWQLHRAVESLPSDAVFNIVVYSESYHVWQDGLAPAKGSSKKKAHKFIDSLVANGVTNIADSLDKAFELAGLVAPGRIKGGGEPAADTIYLLSDGDPNRGRVTVLDQLLEDVVSRNPPGGIVIHAVGIGEASGSSFLKSLAERTGGRYVGYR